MDVVIFTVLGLMLQAASAHPVSNSATNQTSFVPEPSGRGTVGLLLSSLLTLSLCCYSALHLDVSDMGFGKSVCGCIPVAFLHKFFTALMCLFYPEVILQGSFFQWLEARKLYKSLQCWSTGKELRGNFIARDSGERERDHEDPNTSELVLLQPIISDANDRSEQHEKDLFHTRWSGWTMEMAFFVAMEGLSYDVSDIANYEISDINENERYVYLDTTTFLCMIKHGFLSPDIVSQQDIADKNKSDALGKFLACAQALWMMVNVLARIASRLPITLLELHVILHVVCTIVTYGFFWFKPLSIVHPVVIPIRDDDAGSVTCDTDTMVSREFVALLLVSKLNKDMKTELEFTLFPEDSSSSPHNSQPELDEQPKQMFKSDDNNGALEPAEIFDSELQYSVKVLGARETAAEISDDTEALMKNRAAYDLASKALRNKRYRDIMVDTNTIIANGSTYTFPKPEWDGYILDSKLHLKTQSCIGLGYGTLHATAWYYNFLSIAEMWLWRWSCIIVASAIPIGIVTSYLFKQLELYVNPPEDKSQTKTPGKMIRDGLLQLSASLFGFVVLICLCSACLLYIGARGFIVVEAFISLRSLPADVYKTVRWSDFWPHI
ncbi:hypothetical protein K440DRAFT_665348 [Wilcoxina mikolae CBS 423.85]|nr:hypothetical protein K440DRAFT_665348 [Wilcoxina mikolae CBS 423.85]